MYQISLFSVIISPFSCNSASVIIPGKSHYATQLLMAPCCNLICEKLYILKAECSICIKCLYINSGYFDKSKDSTTYVYVGYWFYPSRQFDFKILLKILTKFCPSSHTRNSSIGSIENSANIFGRLHTLRCCINMILIVLLQIAYRFTSKYLLFLRKFIKNSCKIKTK